MTSGLNTVNEALLEGHLGIARELVYPLEAEKKRKYGSAEDGSRLIKVGLCAGGSESWMIVWGPIG